MPPAPNPPCKRNYREWRSSKSQFAMRHAEISARMQVRRLGEGSLRQPSRGVFKGNCLSKTCRRGKGCVTDPACFGNIQAQCFLGKFLGIPAHTGHFCLSVWELAAAGLPGRAPFCLPQKASVLGCVLGLESCVGGRLPRGMPPRAQVDKRSLGVACFRIPFGRPNIRLPIAGRPSWLCS